MFNFLSTKDKAIKEEIRLDKQNAKKQKNLFDNFNKVINNSDELFKLGEPNIYTLAQENNIAQKLDNEIIVTKDKNYCMGFEISGISYSATNASEELKFSLARNSFFSSLNSNLEMNIICKKEKIELENTNYNIDNIHAKQIIEKWESNKKAFKISYYIILSTKTKNITGTLEGIKNSTTKEKDTEKEQDEKIFVASDENKINLLNETKIKLKNTLSSFGIRILNSNELINIFASYSNMKHTNFKYSKELITDSYITSNVEFKKDYIVFDTNEGKKIYARFLSIKAYETEEITSLISTAILRENIEYMIFIHAESISKSQSIKKIKDIKAFAIEEVRVSLEELIKAINTDREKLMLVSYSILIHDETLEELEEKTNELIGVLENQNLAVVRENLNLKPLFFSFYPSRGNLNVRKRSIQSSNLACMVNFENDILGLPKTRWGNYPITTFKHLSGSPYLFNFHENSSNSSAGHTIIVGGSGSGKTMLTQFLMLNLMKYNINIFAMDKLRGMKNFAEFCEGEYHDSDTEFKLNPFSLADTNENNAFLNMFLCKMGHIPKDKYNLINIVASTIKRLRYARDNNNIIKLTDFITSLENNDEEAIKNRYQSFIDSIFDNYDDALNFKKQLSILNMDSILKDQSQTALVALYIFHKLKNISKNTGKGFFIFIDELKDYLLEETMRETILEAILEIRKINGVIAMAVQNLDFFNDIPKSQSFIDNMSNFIIFPTNNESVLNNLREKVRLTESEISFLAQTQISERKILLKQPRINSSCILDVDFSALGDYIKIFSSEATDVNYMEELKKYKPNEWRQLYLKGEIQ